MMPNPNGLNTVVCLINTKGRVIRIPANLQHEYVKKGFTPVENPKQEYYPQYDQSIPDQKRALIERTPDMFLKVEIL